MPIFSACPSERRGDGLPLSLSSTPTRRAACLSHNLPHFAVARYLYLAFHGLPALINYPTGAGHVPAARAAAARGPGYGTARFLPPFRCACLLGLAGCQQAASPAAHARGSGLVLDVNTCRHTLRDDAWTGFT